MPSSHWVKSDKEWILVNEFAQVRLTIDTAGNDPRLKIEDLNTNATVTLDAFALSGLTTISEQDMNRYMDPNPKMDH